MIQRHPKIQAISKYSHQSLTVKVLEDALLCQLMRVYPKVEWTSAKMTNFPELLHVMLVLLHVQSRLPEKRSRSTHDWLHTRLTTHDYTRLTLSRFREINVILAFNLATTFLISNDDSFDKPLASFSSTRIFVFHR